MIMMMLGLDANWAGACCAGAWTGRCCAKASGGTASINAVEIAIERFMNDLPLFAGLF